MKKSITFTTLSLAALLLTPLASAKGQKYQQTYVNGKPALVISTNNTTVAMRTGGKQASQLIYVGRDAKTGRAIYKRRAQQRTPYSQSKRTCGTRSHR